MFTGTNLTYTKEFNLRIVHETIRLFGPLSRADIARRTELTVQTVSNLVKQLIADGIVYEASREQEGRGAPSIKLALNPDGAFAVGLDLDRDHLTGVLIDLTGNVRQRVHFDLDFPAPEQALDLMVNAVHTLVERQGLPLSRVRGVGVGTPGPMHMARDGSGHYVMNPKAFPGWHDVPVASELQRRLGLPAYLENNATAAAIGERWFGAGQHFRTFFYVYFGSGLGGGLVVDGQPYEGFSGNAGEIGYLSMPATGDGVPHERPHLGLHFYLPRLLQTLSVGREQPLHLDDLDGLMHESHPELLWWMDEAVHLLTETVLAVEYLIDPQAIFFGGRLPDAMIARLLEGVQKRLPQRRISGKLSGPHLHLALAGSDAAALGVATLPIYELFAAAPQVLLKQPDGHASGAPRFATSG